MQPIRQQRQSLKAQKANFKTFQTELPLGTALYRYSTKQYSDGTEAGARKNWAEELKNDTGNRWTGTAETGSGGSGGLYMSLEAEKGLDTEFPELNHYQSNDQYDQETDIAFYDFKKIAQCIPRPRHSTICSHFSFRKN